jgi:uncharacterized protein (TIGR00730 family)
MRGEEESVPMAADGMTGAICVFAGSSLGNDAAFEHCAVELGRALVRRNLGLVYGGANVGLMGVLADAVLEAGGLVIGVIPDFLVGLEIAHPGLTELIVVSSMHERKDTMARRCDGFIALPGGFGTIEELFEALTWGQLRLHAKPCGLLNAGGYYDGLLRFLDHGVAQRLIAPENRAMVLVNEDPGMLLDAFEAYQAPADVKWIRSDRT